MKIAYITSRFPYPVEKGDKLRAFHQIKSLATEHEVHLFALTHHDISEDQLHALDAYCASVHTYKLSRMQVAWNTLLAGLNGLPLQVGYFYSSTVKRQLQSDMIKLGPDHIFAQLIRTAEYVRNLPIAKTLDYMDTFSVGSYQRSVSGPWLLRPVYRWEAAMLKRYERRVYADFDNHAIISEQDRDRLPLPYTPSVTVLANGVDTEFYSPRKDSEQWTVLFVGNMGYLPNIEGAEFLVRRVMPLVWETHPEATVCLAGARPAARVQRLAGKRVHVTGWVDDIRDCYAASRIFVAPMFTGMGLQNKILEAMSMGLPCVTTAIVNNAIGAEPSVEVEVGNSAPEIAGMIHKLLDNPHLCTNIGGGGRQLVMNMYSWANQNKSLNSIISSHKQTESGIPTL